MLLEFPVVRAGAEPRPLRVSREATRHPAVAAVLRSDDVSLDEWIRRASLDDHAAAVDGDGTTLLHCLALRSKTAAMVRLLGSAAERLRPRRDAARDAARREGLAARTQDDEDDDVARRETLLAALDAAERLYHAGREAHARTLLGARDGFGRTALHYAAAARGASVRCLVEALPVAGADLSAVGPSGLPLFPPGSHIDTRTGRLFGASDGYLAALRAVSAQKRSVALISTTLAPGADQLTGTASTLDQIGLDVSGTFRIGSGPEEDSAARNVWTRKPLSPFRPPRPAAAPGSPGRRPSQRSSSRPRLAAGPLAGAGGATDGSRGRAEHSPPIGSPGMRSQRRRAGGEAEQSFRASRAGGFAVGGPSREAKGGGGGSELEATAPDGTPRLAVDDVPVARCEWVDAADDDGYTALHVAAASGDASAARLLLGAGAFRYARSADGETPLTLSTTDALRRVLLPLDDAVGDVCAAAAAQAAAAGRGAAEGGRQSLGMSRRSVTIAPGTQGAEESEAGSGDVGPSDSASQSGAAPPATEEQLREIVAGPLQALRMLLSTGLNPNGRSGTLLRAPLHSAAEAGQPEVVSVLLQSGAVVDVVDANGWTPLAVAALAGTSPSAASPGHMECARRLLAAGASVGATTSMRRTALHLAAVMQGTPVSNAGTRGPGKLFSDTDALSVASSVPRSTGSSSQATGAAGPRQAANAGRAASGKASAAASEAEPNETAEPGVVESEELEQEQEHGAGEEEGRGEEEGPPPGPAMLWLLLRSGANPDAKDDDGMTPLLLAAKHGRAGAAAALLACGAFADVTTRRGATALHLAAQHGHIATIRLLVRHDAERGVMKRCVDSAGRSPLDRAKTPAARAALDTLWEAAAAGRLDATQRMLRVASRVDPGVSAPWQPVQVWDRTRDLERTALHAVVCGAAAAVSSLRDAARKAALSSTSASAGSRARGRGPSAPGAVAAARRMRNVIAGIGLQSNAQGGVSHPKALPGKSCSTLQRRGNARQAAAARAEQEAEEPFARVAALLLSNGADPDAADADGVTALMLAARFGLCLVCRAILPKVSLSVADAAGNTALHWAQAFCQVAVADLLLDDGADPEALNANGDTPDGVSGAGMGLVSPTSAEAMLARAPQRPKESASLKATLLRDSLQGSGAALEPKP